MLDKMTRSSVAFELHGEPRGKGRPRFIRKTGHPYTPERTAVYESALCLAGQKAMEGRAILEGPLSVTVEAIFQPAASWPEKRKAAALLGIEWPTKKPDCDNILKCLDALNGVVWIDDKQIVTLMITKRYAKTPMLRIIVETLRLVQLNAHLQEM
jgi:Holliday junction resolvase RusA-like endonuclease